jgi:DNA-directed RNA polymerase I, II, and III subunit RPABC1
MEDRPLQTLKSMLKSRGITAEEFESVGNPLDETKMYTLGGVLIIFSEKTRITEKELNNFFTFASENNYTAGMIIISSTKASEKVLEVLRHYISNRENPLAQIFFVSHLNFDISQHRKVPKHRVITDDEVQTMMKKFNIKELSNLPKIDCQDAMAKWIGARPGDVIEVTGMCVSSGENTRYRYCVPNVYEV